MLDAAGSAGRGCAVQRAALTGRAQIGCCRSISAAVASWVTALAGRCSPLFLVGANSAVGTRALFSQRRNRARRADDCRGTAALLVLSGEGAWGACRWCCGALSARRTWRAVNTRCLPSHRLEPSCFAPRADRAATTRHAAWLTLHRRRAARGARVPLQAAHAIVGTRQIGGHPICAAIAEQRRARSWPAV